MTADPNADLEHTNLTRYGAGGDCMTCGVKWPCPTVARRMNAGPTDRREAAIATVETSRQTHVEWAAFLRRNPDHDPGAIGDAEYHEGVVREYDNVLAVLTAAPTGPDPRTDAAVGR